MKKYGLLRPMRKANPYRRTAKALKANAIAPNPLDREFEAHGPRTVLFADAAYIINGKAPRRHMPAIIGACAKELLARVLSESLEIGFALETVKQLVENHGALLAANVLIHSDQGSHCASVQFIQLAKDGGLRQPMPRRADCRGNAPQESFCGHMKDEIDISSCLALDAIHQRISGWTDRCGWRAL
ncbi:MAG: hypothetical protein LBU32_14675 [Clostridiales bacterium]|jgi:transposase InsO family protein|nr:hypothetical protein [Clostridiales bacterium]